MSSEVKVLVIDWMNLVKRYMYHGEDCIDLSTFIDDHATKILDRFTGILRKYPFSFAIICSDNGQNKRAKAILSEYKANRNKQKTETQKEMERSHYKYLRDMFDCFPIPFVETKNTEADMIIYFAKEYLNKYVFEPNSEKINPSFRVISSDSDFIQLLDQNTKIFTYRKDMEYQDWNTSLEEEYWLPPTTYALMKSIVGDKADNIEGIRNIGWKKTYKLFKFMHQNGVPETSLVNPSTFIENLNNFNLSENFTKPEINFINKMKETISNNKELIVRNYSIIDFASLETPYIYTILKSLERGIFDSELKYDVEKIVDMLELDNRYSTEDAKGVKTKIRSNLYLISNTFEKHNKVIDILRKARKEV